MRNLILPFAILFAAALLTACSSIPKTLAVDPCMVQPDSWDCYAVPLNQPAKPEYVRKIEPGDVCFSIDEYVQIQKAMSAPRCER